MNKHKMRGIICAFFASTLLVGCNSNASDAVPINEISFNDTVIKYNETIPENMYDYEYTSMLKCSDATDLALITNKEGIVRCIIIKTPDIKTFKGISVGQSANRITSSYEYEIEGKNSYDVFFSGEDEIDIINNRDSISDDDFHLYYLIEDDKISSIYIMDYQYGVKSK